MKNENANQKPTPKETQKQVEDNQTPPQPGNVKPVENTGSNLVDQKPKFDRGDGDYHSSAAADVAKAADYTYQEGGLPRKEEDKAAKPAVDLENPDPTTRKSSI